MKNPEQEEIGLKEKSIEQIIEEAHQLGKKVDNSSIRLGSINQDKINFVAKTDLQNKNSCKKIWLWMKACSSKKNLLMSGSILGGVGVGLAMMPIFNEEVEHLEDYGVNIHNNESWLIASTVNTLLLMSTYSVCQFYKYFSASSSNNQTELNSSQQKLLLASKICAVSAAIFPASLLWNIELQNQEVDKSSGFDQFIAWATFTTAPLVFFKALITYHSLEEFITSGLRQSIEFSSLGAKITTYGIGGTALIARGIAFTFASKELMKNLGFDEDTALGVSIVIGGMIGNSLCGISEHSKLKALFKESNEGLTLKEIVLGIFAAIEAGWFSLPAISAGLEATEDWNPLLRGALFVPLFLSYANTEATEMYHALIPHSSHHTNGHDSTVSLVGYDTQEGIEQ